MELFDPDATLPLPLANARGFRFLSIFKVRMASAVVRFCGGILRFSDLRRDSVAAVGGA